MTRDARLRAAALTGAALLLLPVAWLAPQQVVTLAGLAAVALLIVQASEWRWPAATLPAVLLGALAVWGALSALWAPAPERSLALALRFVGFGVGIALLTDAARRLTPDARGRLPGALMLGAAITGVGVVLAVLVERDLAAGLGFDLGLSQAELVARFNRLTAVLAILAWPLALVVARRFGVLWAALALIAVAALLVGLNPRSPTVALAAGAAVLGLAWLSQRVAVAALALVIVAMIAAVPLMETLFPLGRDALLALTAEPVSQVHRLAIWQFAAERIAERPLFGWGLDASRALPGSDVALELMRRPSGEPVMAPAVTLHPHNALIQVWLELGVPGLVVAALMFRFLLQGAGDATDRAGAAVRLATLATALTVAQLSFGIWQGWWMAALGLAGVLTAAVTARAPP